MVVVEASDGIEERKQQDCVSISCKKLKKMRLKSRENEFKPCAVVALVDATRVQKSEGTLDLDKYEIYSEIVMLRWCLLVGWHGAS